MTSSFSQLSLAPSLARAVADMGYENMTPIQEQAIPVVLEGRDVMGAAQTGTGKTAAFSLPLIQRMLKHENASTSPARHPVRALVLLPTRELADQVAQQVKAYAKYTNIRSAVVFGGMDMKPQTIELKAGVEILVATPGRLLDHIEAKNCVLNQVEYVVLDEADRMLDIGFLPDLERILSFLPKQRTTLLFSATFSPEIKRLSSSYLQNPVTIEVARPNQTASTVKQHFFSTPTDEKLHGDKSQDERLKALEAFKSGAVDLLVATDVAARGLDIKDVPAVFNFDLPFNAEDYVHRIGRTGRAGASGVAISFVAPSDGRLVVDLEKLLKTKIELEGIEYPENLPDIRKQGRINDGRRMYSGGDSDGEESGRSNRNSYRDRSDDRNARDVAQGQGERYAFKGPKPKALDPFFDKPYESAPVVAEGSTAPAPAWEAASKANPPRAGKSANIRPKKRVAALFKAIAEPIAEPKQEIAEIN
jgi:ATP-dependent RNA helicase RhlE